MRPEEVGPQHPLALLFGDLRRTGQLTEVKLGPLDAADVAERAESVAGRDLDPDDVRRLHDETEGQPLFVVETIRAGLGINDRATSSADRLASTNATAICATTFMR